MITAERGGQLTEQVTATAAVGAVPVPRNPYVVAAPAPSEPFQEALVTVVVEPDDDTVPPQDCATVAPPGSVKVVFQELIAADPAVTVTVPWNPPDQEPSSLNDAVHPLPTGLVGETVTGVVRIGVVCTGVVRTGVVCTGVV